MDRSIDQRSVAWSLRFLLEYELNNTVLIELFKEPLGTARQQQLLTVRDYLVQRIKHLKTLTETDQ
jgi:hypothetical protein